LRHLFWSADPEANSPTEPRLMVGDLGNSYWGHDVSKPDDEWLAVLEATHASVLAYARVEFDALCRKVIHRLQRIDASGIYGDDYNYKTLWDEYCHEMQHGPTELLTSAWDATILPLLNHVVERIPRQVAVLLSIAAACELDERNTEWILDESDNEWMGVSWPDGIREVVRSRVNEKAGWRDLYRFDR
jgi:hypothetical protein